MRQHRTDNAEPIKIAVYCLLFLVSLTALGSRLLGEKKLIDYAMLSRPYWITFTEKASAVRRPSSSGLPRVETRENKIFSFGDSNAFYPEGEDSDLALLLVDAMSTKPESPAMTVIKWHYSGANMFDFYCMFYRAMKESPDLIILPINWLTFRRAFIDLHFHPEMSMFVPLRTRFSATYENPLSMRGISFENHLQYKLHYFSRYPEGLRSWARENTKTSWEKLSGNRSATVKSRRIVDNFFSPDPVRQGPAFQTQIEDSNLTLRTLSAFAHVASEHEVPVLFYIWPLDYEYLEDNAFLERAAFEQAKKLVIDTARKPNVYVEDFSYLLAHRYFHDISGHCTKDGREIIADALATSVLEILREDPRRHE